jgi:hypothetical protein
LQKGSFGCLFCLADRLRAVCPDADARALDADIAFAAQYCDFLTEQIRALRPNQ